MKQVQRLIIRSAEYSAQLKRRRISHEAGLVIARWMYNAIPNIFRMGPSVRFLPFGYAYADGLCSGGNFVL